MLMRIVLFLLLGIGLLLVGSWALTYLVTPVDFRPGVAQFVLAVVLLVGLGVLMLRRRHAR
jgi:hypothetical protein